MKTVILTAALILSLSKSALSKVYEIKAGAHSASGYNFGFFTASSLSFQAKFNSSAIYNLGNINQFDINKLFGFSDCSTAHQTNSARFGWVWNLETAELEIHAYT